MSVKSLPIPELIKLIKNSFRESDFDEVEKVLMERETRMKAEMDRFLKERDAMRNEVKLLERKHGLSEFENAKLDDKCKGLERRIVSLVEEKKVVSGNVTKVEEKLGKSLRKCEGLEERITRLGREKDQIIVELKKKNLDNERFLREYQEKYQSLDDKVRRMEDEMKDLREEKLKADKAAEDSNKRFEDLAPKILTVEKGLEILMGVLPEDIPELVNELDNLGKGGGNLVLCSTIKDDAVNSVKISPGRQPSTDLPQMETNATDLENRSEQLKSSGVRNHDGANAVENSPGPHPPARPQMEIIATDHENGSKRLPPSGDIIDLCDSDDEVAHTANASENATNILNRGDVDKGSPISSTLKRKRSLIKNDHEASSTVQVLELDTDDDPCSDSDMDNLVASIRSKKSGRVDVPCPSSRSTGIKSSS